MAENMLFWINDEPCRVEGWLNVWEVGDDLLQRLTGSTKPVLPIWEPHFCVLSQGKAKLNHYRSEKTARDRCILNDIMTISTEVSTMRLDGSKAAFDKRWGYGALESIKETSPLHGFGSLYSFNNKTQTLDGRTSYNYSAYEKSTIGDRRGSVPVVSSPEDDTIDMPSTPSKLASFFNKKVKSNLKRTKSVTKLDRKRPPVVNDNDSGARMTSLRRTMSLGRLTKRWQPKNQRPTNLEDQKQLSISQNSLDLDALLASRIRASRSHESLLVSPSSMHAIDLSAPDVEIKPLHSSILGQEHCFQVTTPNGSKYYSCRTAFERQKWIQSLRKSMHPQQERTTRTENSLTIWVLEAKNLLPKKRYFCEIHLDSTLYARTASKTVSDMLFWGEQFDFSNLPAVETIVINLYREPDKKKKKDKHLLVGTVKLNVKELTKRQPVERWYPTCATIAGGKSSKDSKNDAPLLRVKARYQNVHVLPMIVYQPLVSYLQKDYTELVAILEPLISVKAKEEIATCMVKILLKLNCVQNFLEDIVMVEVNKSDNENLTFRGNSIATKAMEAYIKIIGEKYLRDTLSDFIKDVLESSSDCEVDPARVSNNTLLLKHQNNLQEFCEIVWYKIMNSSGYFPLSLRKVFYKLREQCRNRTDISDHLISSCLFLRFLCPAILSPSLFSLVSTFPCEKSSRNLTLIAKTVQNLANFTKFGAKEVYMNFMNNIVEREMPNMKNFLHQISSKCSDPVPEYEGYIDLGKELSCLQSLLTESFEKANESTTQKITHLTVILQDIEECVKDSTILAQRQEELSKLYLNKTHIQDANANPTNNTVNGNESDSLHIHDNTLSSQNNSIPQHHMPRSDSSDSDYVTLDNSVTNHILNQQKEQQLNKFTPGTYNRTNTRPLNEHSVNKNWNSILNEADKVSAANMVNGDYTELLMYVDDHSGISAVSDADTCSQTSFSQQSTIASSGYHSATPYNAGYDTSKSDTHTAPNTTNSSAQYALSFANPMFQKDSTYTPGSPNSVNSVASINKDNSALSASMSSTPSHQMSRSYSHDLVSSPMPPVEVCCSSSSSESLLSLNDTGLAVAQSPRRHARKNRHNMRHVSQSSTCLHNASITSRPPLHSASSVEYPMNNELSISAAHASKLSKSVDLSQAYRKQPSPLGIRRLMTPHTQHHMQATDSANSQSYVEQRRVQRYKPASSNDSLSPRNENAERKNYYEEELSALRAKLAETQNMLSEAQQKIADQDNRNQILMKSAETNGNTNRQDDQQSIEARKQMIIHEQARRIMALDAANSRLHSALTNIQEGFHVKNNGVISAPSRTKLSLTADAGQFKTSSC